MCYFKMRILTIFFRFSGLRMVNTSSNCILARMFKVTKYFFIASILLFAASMYFSVTRDIKNLQDGRCCDLRKRIVGSRYQSEGLSPYFFKWQQGYPERLCNPYESGPALKQNVVSMPPSYLWVIQPLAKFSFPKIETIWLVVQYLALILMLLLFLWHSQHLVNKTLLLVAFSLFLFSRSWIVNVDIGQSYMIFPLLLAAGYCTFSDKKNRFFYAGMLLALCCWLRPNFILFALPFLADRERNQFFRGALIMGVLCVLQVFIFGQWQNWVDFVKSSTMWMDFYNHLDASSPSDFGNGVYPASIEGQTDFSISKLPDYISNFHIAANTVLGIKLPTVLWSAILGISLMTICTAIYKKRNIVNYSQYWFAGFFCYYLGELLVSVPKPSYYFVELFFPLCIILSNASVKRNIPLYLIFSGLLLATLFVKIIPMQLLISEYIIALALLITFIGFFTDKNKPSTIR
jgi:Glycosyltransferase family 87